MTDDEARASADLADRVAQQWGQRPDEFHVAAVDHEFARVCLAKTFGGPIVERVPGERLVTAFTGERRPFYGFHVADMVRLVAQ